MTDRAQQIEEAGRVHHAAIDAAYEALAVANAAHSDADADAAYAALTAADAAYLAIVEPIDKEYPA